MTSRVRARRWTIIPPVRLRGVGTSQVESLASYVRRITDITGTSRQRMYNLINSMAGRTRGRSLQTRAELFAKKLEVLRDLTGEPNVECGTFWRTANVIQKMTVASRKWCPQCNLEKDREPYEPLAWSMELKKTCDVHGCLLEDKCPRCGATQGWETLSSKRPTICRSCTHPLSGSRKPALLFGYEKWIETQLTGLIAVCAEPGQSPFPNNTYARFLAGLWQIAHSRERVPAALLCALLRGHIRSSDPPTPTLRMLLNLCALQAVSAIQVLFDPAGASSAPLIDLWGTFEALPLECGMHSRQAHVFDTSLACLLRICGQGYLPPADLVLRAIGMTRERALDIRPDIYTVYQATLLEQDAYSSHADARRALIAAMRILASQAKSPKGHRVRSAIAAQIMIETRVRGNVAENVLDTALALRSVLQLAKKLMSRAPPQIKEEPLWMKGYMSAAAVRTHIKITQEHLGFA